jgi:hypothetical protein
MLLLRSKCIEMMFVSPNPGAGIVLPDLTRLSQSRLMESFCSHKLGHSFHTASQKSTIIGFTSFFNSYHAIISKPNRVYEYN